MTKEHVLNITAQIDQIKKLMYKGVSAEEIASSIGLSIDEWKALVESNTELYEGLRGVAEDYAKEIRTALYERAVGSIVVEKKTVKTKVNADGETVVETTYEKRYPPDTQACIYFLNTYLKQTEIEYFNKNVLLFPQEDPLSHIFNDVDYSKYRKKKETKADRTL